MKTFAVAGVSTLNGVVKYRFAADMLRIKVLEKNGHTDIQLFELPQPMDKDGAVLWLKTEKNIVVEDNDVAPKAPKAPRAKKEKPAKAEAAEDAQDDTPDDDGFVEPKDERIQVLMSKKAREYPGLQAKQLYEMVMLDLKAFPEDGEPNF
jgi:hypothetical protein